MRRYDIDCLRVIAIGLLIIYHIGIGFQPWGVFIGFIQSNESLEYLWPFMSMLNVWRIPLLFFVSGMGVAFAIRKRNWKQLILERSRRILLPFLFGMIFIVPIHTLIWQDYYHQDLKYAPNMGHLWFLANIFVYVLVLSPVFFHLKKNKSGRAKRWIKTLFSKPPGLLFVAACFALEAILVNPESYSLYALTIHGFMIGLLAFFFGYCFIISGEGFWQLLGKWRYLLLVLALGLYLTRYLLFKLEAPGFLIALESCCWIFTVFSFGNRYLNRPGKVLAYLNQAAYPVYILHMLFLYLGSSLLFSIEAPTLVKFILLNLFTLSGCFAAYEIIKRLKFMRPLFGLKP